MEGTQNRKKKKVLQKKTDSFRDSLLILPFFGIFASKHSNGT